MVISRRKAIRQGLSIFYTSPCKHGHRDGRFVSNSKCVKCFNVNKQYAVKYEEEYIQYLKVVPKTNKFRFIMLSHVKKARSDFAILVRRIKTNRDLDLLSTLGYSASNLKEHMESQFKTGMNWDNIGDWEFDHILPLYKFTLYDSRVNYTPTQFSFIVNNIFNIQPLWKKENQKKSYKF